MIDATRFSTIIENIRRRKKQVIKGLWFNIIELDDCRLIHGPIGVNDHPDSRDIRLALIDKGNRQRDMAGFWPETAGRLLTEGEAVIVSDFIRSRNGNDVELVVPLRNNRRPVQWFSFEESREYPLYKEQIYPRILDLLRGIPFMHLLDAGCGSGNLLRKIRRRYPHVKCHGVDISPENVESARAKGFTHIHEGNARDIEKLLPGGETFDMIMFCGVLNRQIMGIGEARTILNKSLSFLRTAGHLLITGYSSCHFCSRYLQRLGLTVLNKSLPENILKSYDDYHLRQLYLARKE
jgi:2-polyprenyl-3-methyl-5-hydroxy-6-metoxy-1,4-benzoquinol methylase